MFLEQNTKKKTSQVLDFIINHFNHILIGSLFGLLFLGATHGHYVEEIWGKYAIETEDLDDDQRTFYRKQIDGWKVGSLYTPNGVLTIVCSILCILSVGLAAYMLKWNTILVIPVSWWIAQYLFRPCFKWSIQLIVPVFVPLLFFFLILINT